MFSYPEIAVYVWLTPVVLFFILPPGVMLARMLFRLAVGSTAFYARSVDDYAVEQGAQFERSPEKRRQVRYPVSGLVADVSDGVTSCTGLVCNISKIGIGLMELPEKLMEEADRLSIIIKGEGGHFPMYLTPQWRDRTGSSLSLGGMVENVPAGWDDFVSLRMS